MFSEAIFDVEELSCSVCRTASICFFLWNNSREPCRAHPPEWSQQARHFYSEAPLCTPVKGVQPGRGRMESSFMTRMLKGSSVDIVCSSREYVHGMD